MSKEIKKLSHKHHLIAYRLLLGEPQKDIAKDIGISEEHVSRVTNSPVFQEEFKKLSDELRARVINHSAEVREIFNAASPNAARKLAKLVDEAPDPKDQIRAADKVVKYSDFGEERDKADRPIVITQQQMVIIEEGLK